jgi:hypothetical protein
MTWIEIIAPSEDPAVAEALASVMPVHPKEYGSPESRARMPPLVRDDSIVRAHSLFADVMEKIFSAYGLLLGPDKPLSRRQHELIATTVSALNRCFY